MHLSLKSRGDKELPAPGPETKTKGFLHMSKARRHCWVTLIMRSGFHLGENRLSWATTVGVSCTAGQKLSRWTQLTSDPAVFETAWQWVTGLLLLPWLTWGLTRSKQGTYVPASWSDPTPRPDKWFSVLEKYTFLTLSLKPNSFKWARRTSRCRTAICSDELIERECKAEGKNPILIRFAPKAKLRNFLWWGRSMRLLDWSWPPVLGSGVRHDLLEERFLNFSHMTERFS